MKRRVITTLIALAVMIATFGLLIWKFQLPAGAAATPPPTHWLISQPELGRLTGAGGTSSFQWVMRDPVRGSDTRGLVPTFTSYYAFARWARGGGSGTAEIDYESSVTPRWQMIHLMRYIRLAAQMGTRHRILTIFSPVTSSITVPTSMLTVDVQA